MNTRPGTVYLVGAGPGDPGLMTLRGLALLRQADVIVHDRLVARELLAEVSQNAEVIDVGKAPGKHRYSQSWINAILVDRAESGRCVVRLKGGDPFLFGRGYEELTACRAAGIECVVVPGVSSALAAPAAVGTPITNRGAARSVAIITGQTGKDEATDTLNYEALAGMDTIVILMGRANLTELTRSLSDAGLDPATPAACIEQATTPRQRVAKATLATIAEVADREGLCAPVVTVIGQVAALAGVADAPRLWSLVEEGITIPRAVV